MRTAVLIVLFFALTFFAQAQEEKNAEGKITGRIIDSLSGKPIEYATIGLFTIGENKVVNGTTADDKGDFIMDNVAEGTYKMMIDFMGYKRLEKSNVTISKGTPSIVMGHIKLSSKQTKLKEVEVTAEHSLIENKIDKMIYNVDKDITSQGGIASDVLKKVPGQNKLLIPISNFPMGVAQFTAFDSKGIARAERLTFVNKDKQLHIDVTTDKEKYLPREKVKMTVSVADDNGVPMPGNFSMSVVNDQLLSFADDRN